MQEETSILISPRNSRNYPPFVRSSDEDNYLLALIRYIHLNPVRAGLVATLEDLDRYHWTGHRAIIGKTRQAWMDIDRVLAEFGSTRRKALHEYRRFMQEGFGQGRLPVLTGGGLIRSKGGWSQVLSARRSGRRAMIAQKGRDELGLSLAEIARHVGVNTSSIRKAILKLEEAK